MQWEIGVVHRLSGPPGSPLVPALKEVGRCPGEIPAISNGDDDHFTGMEHVLEGSQLVIGYAGQCVELARRYLLIRKGVLLPQIHLAAHIAYLTHMWHVEERRWVPVQVGINGAADRPPATDALIVYPQSLGNFVGHVGVIVEVGDDYVRVADQNRFFHHWGDDNHSATFKLERTPEGKWRIRDPEVECACWVEVPSVAERPRTAPPVDPGDLKVAPRLSSWRYLSFFCRGFWGFGQKWKFLRIFVPIVLYHFTRNVIGSFWGGGLKKTTHEGGAGAAGSPRSAPMQDGALDESAECEWEGKERCKEKVL